jgi:hypothetical protein
MAIITIDTDICFECGEPYGEMHHVIPRVRGGTKTIPLCVECHCKVHGLKNRPDHKRLTIEGLQKAKARGVKLGKPENLTQEAKDKGNRAIKQKALDNENNKKAMVVVVDGRNKGYSYDKIADILNKNGYKTVKGKLFNSSGTCRLYKRYLNNLG